MLFACHPPLLPCSLIVPGDTTPYQSTTYLPSSVSLDAVYSVSGANAMFSIDGSSGMLQ